MSSMQEFTGSARFQDPLCSVCKGLFSRGRGSHSKIYPHHESVSSLYQGIDLGCRVCILIWERMTQEQCQFINQKRNEKFELSRSHHYYGHITRDDIYQYFHVIVEVLETSAPAVKAIRIDLGLEPIERLPEVASHNWIVHESSIEALDLAEDWYNQCCWHHFECRRETWPHNYQGPSRLVDISMSESSLWRLCEANESRLNKVQYFTLSHCWGKSPLLQLNSSTIQAMKLGMPLSCLPQTFQDAIYIARKLDAGYIWIDSLCIMQDSVQDWQHESARMRDIYQYSACNIAATSATDSTEGCLFQRVERSTDELWQVQAGPWAGSKNYFVLDLHKLADQVQNAPLNSRGWVVQERILSARTLHMGRSQIFWECNRGLACEFWPKSIPKAFENVFGSMYRNIRTELHSRRPKSSDEHPTQIYAIWYDIVARYTDCHLTKSSDKLVAISGIAQVFQDFLPGDAYVSGLWENDFAHGLLWRAASDSDASLVGVHGRAPTWSWASVDGSIQPEGRRHVIDKQAILIRNINVERNSNTTASTSLAKASRLEFTGILFECIFEEKKPGFPGGFFKPNMLFSTAPDVSGSLYPDTEYRSVFARRSFFCLPVLEYVARGECILKGLMLMPIDDSRTVFTRVGFWETRSHDQAYIRVFRIKQQNLLLI